MFNKGRFSLSGVLTFIGTVFLMSGCSSVISGASQELAQKLQSTMSNHNDPQLIKEALPGYMLMLESFIDKEEPSQDMLQAAAEMYIAYSGAFVDDIERQKKLSGRGFDFAKEAVCLHKTQFCELKSKNYAAFLDIIEQVEEDDVSVLATYGVAWGNWLKANSDDFNAIADLPKVTRLMERLVAIEDDFQQGNGHLYLGLIHSLTPPAVGGKPELAKRHFERAIELSDGKNLMVKVTYAQQYARMMFDQELHDRLLNEVLQADPVVPDLTLNNTLAQQAAQQLLASAEDYF